VKSYRILDAAPVTARLVLLLAALPAATPAPEIEPSRSPDFGLPSMMQNRAPQLSFTSFE